MLNGLFIGTKVNQLRLRIVPFKTWTRSWSSCQARFSEMRSKHPNTPPDGFLVFDSTGNEVRRWFELARPKA